jgi:hypothetical protein
MLLKRVERGDLKARWVDLRNTYAAAASSWAQRR